MKRSIATGLVLLCMALSVREVYAQQSCTLPSGRTYAHGEEWCVDYQYKVARCDNGKRVYTGEACRPKANRCIRTNGSVAYRGSTSCLADHFEHRCDLDRDTWELVWVKTSKVCGLTNKCTIGGRSFPQWSVECINGRVHNCIRQGSELVWKKSNTPCGDVNLCAYKGKTHDEGDKICNFDIKRFQTCECSLNNGSKECRWNRLQQQCNGCRSPDALPGTRRCIKRRENVCTIYQDGPRWRALEAKCTYWCFRGNKRFTPGQAVCKPTGQKLRCELDGAHPKWVSAGRCSPQIRRIPRTRPPQNSASPVGPPAPLRFSVAGRPPWGWVWLPPW